MLTKNKRPIGILLSVVFILLVPIIAMQFSDEVNWSPFDFVVAGGLLLALGLLCEFVIRKAKHEGNRAVIIIVILIAFFLTWAELSVGIFGTPLAGS